MFKYRNPISTVLGLLLLALVFTAETAATRQTQQSSTPPDDGKLRIIAFGAHPDDCELQVGGVASMWAAQGHHV